MATSLQETVGVPISDEQKRLLMQEFGFKERHNEMDDAERMKYMQAIGHNATPGPSTTTSTRASAASTSTSTGAGKEVKNTFEKKKGRLLTRGVNKEAPAGKNFTQEIESAAEDMEEELIPAQLAPPVAPASAMGGGHEFWAKMNTVFDMKLLGFGQEFGAALHGVETRLGAEIQKERDVRRDENKSSNERIDAAPERLDKLEKKREESPPRTSSDSVPSPSGGWQPRHLISGGWPPRTGREQIEDEAKRWLLKLPENLRMQLLNPYVPKKYGEIAKCKVQQGRIHSCAGDVSKWMET